MSKPAAPPVIAKCGVCGADVRPPFQIPSSDTSPDLDMRPGEPARSTLRKWLNVCPVCEAVAPDLSRLTQAAMVGMGVPGYFTTKAPRSVMPFLRWSMLCVQTERAEALLQAAWAADDANEKQLAAQYRKQAAACWPEPMTIASSLRLVDVLRRAGDFDGAAVQAAALDGLDLDDSAVRLLAYQRKLIAARDGERHLLSSALPQPARMPHVAHVQEKQKSGGFWSWLKKR